MRPHYMIKGILISPWRVHDPVFNATGTRIPVFDSSSDDKTFYHPGGAVVSGAKPDANIKHSTKKSSEYQFEKPEIKRKGVNVVSGNSIEAEHVPGHISGETLIRHATAVFSTTTELLSSIQRNIQEQSEWLQSRVCRSELDEALE